MERVSGPAISWHVPFASGVLCLRALPRLRQPFQDEQEIQALESVFFDVRELFLSCQILAPTGAFVNRFRA